METTEKRRSANKPTITRLKFSEDEKGKPISSFQGYKVKPCNMGTSCPHCQGVFDLTRYIGKKGPKRPKVMIFTDDVKHSKGEPFLVAHKSTPDEVRVTQTLPSFTERLLGRKQKGVTPVSIVTLGGMPFRGGSCTAYWNHETDTIIIIDYGRKVKNQTQDLDEAGKQKKWEIDPFELPYEDFLVQYRDKIQGIIVTHLHIDHCGALPYIPEEIKDILVCLTPLCYLTVKSMCEMAETPEPENMVIFQPGDKIADLSGFKVKSFPLLHSALETVGFDIRAGNQRILHFGDFNLAGLNQQERETQNKLFDELIKEGQIDCLTFDAVGAAREGKRLYEERIYTDIEKIIAEAPGRVIIPIFSSSIGRIQKLIEIAEKHGRRATPWGNAMETSWRNASKLGYLKTTMKTSDLTVTELLDSSKEVAFVTGGQAEPGAQLTKSAFGDERSNLRLRHDDLIAFCQDPIPGNEKRVQGLDNRLTEDGYEITRNGNNGLVTHVSGHNLQGDLDDFFTQFRRYTRLFYPQHMSSRTWEIVEERYGSKYNLITPKFKERTPLWEQ